jgi:hypothetical protein
MRTLAEAERNREINANACARLRVLFEVLETCLEDKIVEYVLADKSTSMCILGWERLVVHDILEFVKRLNSMTNDVWNKFAVTLKNPSWCVYNLLRQIGVRPLLRGPRCSDPGSTNMLYYENWVFRNDERFCHNRKRLEKGFEYNPERGRRVRKVFRK